MIKLWYSDKRQAVMVERLVSVVIDDQDCRAEQTALTEQINQMGPENWRLRSIPFSEELWSEILEIGTIINDD